MILEYKINHYFKGKQPLSKDELVNAISNEFPNLNLNTITVYLSKLKKEGVLNNPTRGVYSIINKPEFEPLLNVSLKTLYNKIVKKFPFISFCLWQTAWLNDLMRHQPFKNYTIMR